VTFRDIERELLYRKVPDNQDRCLACGHRFYWWELSAGRCELCGPDEPEGAECRP
jgi:hypothetical protein